MKFAFVCLVVALLPALLFALEEKPLPKDLPPFEPDRPLPTLSIDEFKVPTGLPAWLVRRPGFPKVTVILAVRGGTAADPKGLEGMAELLASTLTEGTPTRTSKRIAEELQAVGGEIQASASDDAILIRIDALASGAREVFSILADVAQNASFPQTEVELAKTNALQQLQVRSAEPGFLAEKAFAAAVYGSHPYRVVAPTPEVIGAVTPEKLKAEFARRFHPDRALLVVVGDLDAALARKTIQGSFGGWKVAGESPAPTPPPPPSSRALLLVDRPGSVQSSILVGRSTVKATDPDYYPLLVANTIFGGSFGSRLTKNIREDKGYTYSPFSRALTHQEDGLLQVRADVRNEVTGASLLEVFYELDRMGATTPTGEEIATAKRFQSGLFLIRNQIQGSVARSLATNWVNGLPPQALSEFVGRVNGVSAEQIRHAGRTYFPSAHQTVVVVGDEGKIKDDVSQFGPFSSPRHPEGAGP
jgi:zinc protease